jgi:hypothetical protein
VKKRKKYMKVEGGGEGETERKSEVRSRRAEEKNGGKQRGKGEADRFSQILRARNPAVSDSGSCSLHSGARAPTPSAARGCG